MALTACPDCGKSISTLATVCPSCGRPRDAEGAVDRKPTPKLPSPVSMLSRRWVKPVLITFAVLWVISLISTALGFDSSTGQRAATADASATDTSGGVSRAPEIVPLPPVPSAQRRVALAVQLQEAYAASMLKNYDIRFQARGKRCDVLHVEAHGVNLYREMMEGLAYGRVLYGRIVPGGVNAAAFAVGFETVVVTNGYDRVSASFGAAQISRSQVRQLPRCTEATAAAIGPDS